MSKEKKDIGNSDINEKPNQGSEISFVFRAVKWREASSEREILVLGKSEFVMRTEDG